MSPVVWTEEVIRAAAEGFRYQDDFRIANPAARSAAKKRFPALLKELFPNRKPCPAKWDKDSLVTEASKYQTKVEFVNGSRSAYFTMLARFPGMIDELFDNQFKRWDMDSVLLEITKFSKKSEFQIKGAGAYGWARRNCPSLIDVFFSESDLRNTRDVVYIWQADDSDIYKVGVTSDTLDLNRLRRVKNASGFTSFKIVAIEKVLVGQAHAVEKLLKSIGEPVVFDSKFDGHSEFRKMTKNEVNYAASIVAVFKEVA